MSAAGVGDDVVSRPPWPVQVVNAVGRRLSDFGPLGRLRAAELVGDARGRTGLHDLGPNTREAFAVLVDALDREADLTSVGRLVFGRMLRSMLTQRLQVVDALRRRPDLATAPVRRPLFVVGLSRTGTTLLQNLLAQADDARPLRGYEAFDPIPPVLRGSKRDTRPLRCALLLGGLHLLVPQLPEIHSISSGGPDEDFQLLSRTAASFVAIQLVHVPSYERWLEAQDTSAFDAVYELHRMQLQTLQADGAGGHWVLKSPAHLNTLDALLRAYPDAVVVQTHRDPVKVVASLASLVTQATALLARPPEPHVVGRRVLQRTTRTLERADRTRAALVGDRIIDVRYADLLADPVAVTERILERGGYPRSAEARTRMRRWLRDNPQHKHGTHRYSLEQFGLDPATVRRATADYRHRYAIPAER